MAKTAIREVKSAKKRAISMGAPIPWRPGFNNHPLAACIDNRITAIDAELDGETHHVCYYFVLTEILAMARKINDYCDNNKVAGDPAAQYWLERFLWRVDSVCQFDLLN